MFQIVTYGMKHYTIVWNVSIYGLWYVKFCLIVIWHSYPVCYSFKSLSIFWTKKPIIWRIYYHNDYIQVKICQFYFWNIEKLRDEFLFRLEKFNIAGNAITFASNHHRDCKKVVGEEAALCVLPKTCIFILCRTWTLYVIFCLALYSFHKINGRYSQRWTKFSPGLNRGLKS